jgi:hypothetical protein
LLYRYPKELLRILFYALSRKRPRLSRLTASHPLKFLSAKRGRRKAHSLSNHSLHGKEEMVSGRYILKKCGDLIPPISEEAKNRYNFINHPFWEVHFPLADY